MTKHLSWIRSKATELVLLGMLCFWSLAWDYQHFGEYQRVGRIKLFLVAAGAVASLKIGKTWHWTVGLFYLYLVATFLHFNFQIGGVLSIFTITATLFVVPEIWDRISLEAFENTVIGAAVIHCVVAAFNLKGIYLFVPLSMKPTEFLPIGLLGQPTLLGPFLVFAGAIAAKRALDGRRVYAAQALGFLIFALATKSSMAAGSLAAVVVLFALFYGGIVGSLASVLGLVVVGLVASRYDANFLWHSGRTEPWRDAWQLHHISPWFGHGIGSWEAVGRGIAQVRKEQFPWTYVHSEPIQGIFELGRIGMALAAAPFAYALARIHFLYLFRDRSKLTYIAGLAVFGANSLANFDLHITPHGQIFAFCLFGVLKAQRT